MTLGVTFGCYCPLHRGHLDLIYAAKKQCERTLVLVCGSSFYVNDRSGGAIPLERRFSMIKEFLEDDTLDVVLVDDVKIGIDASCSDSNWEKWLSYVDRIINEYKCDYEIEKSDTRWYFSEEDYIRHLGKFYGENLRYAMLHKETHVSGTECRKNPIKYWNYIAAPFHKYYCHNILVTGTASEGKTTLVHDIGKYFSIPYSYEKARDLYVNKTDRLFTFRDFLYNITAQNDYNASLISSLWNPGCIISDSDNITTLLYAWSYAQRSGFSISWQDYESLESVVNQYAKHIRWDKIYLLKPSKRDIVDDGTRLMEDGDFNVRVTYYDKLVELYHKFGYVFEELEGCNFDYNFRRVKAHVEKVLGEKQ